MDNCYDSTSLTRGRTMAVKKGLTLWIFHKSADSNSPWDVCDAGVRTIRHMFWRTWNVGADGKRFIHSLPKKLTKMLGPVCRWRWSCVKMAMFSCRVAAATATLSWNCSLPMKARADAIAPVRYHFRLETVTHGLTCAWQLNLWQVKSTWISTFANNQHLGDYRLRLQFNAWACMMKNRLYKLWKGRVSVWNSKHLPMPINPNYQWSSSPWDPQKKGDTMAFVDLANEIRIILVSVTKKFVNVYRNSTDLNVDGSFISLGDNVWGPARLGIPYDSVDEVNHRKMKKRHHVVEA